MSVSISNCEDYSPAAVEAALRTSLDRIGGIESFVRPGSIVLVKTNLLSRAVPDRAVTTHPEVIRAVIREVRRVGGVPRVGDSPGGPNTPGQWRRICEDSGIGQVCREENVELVLLDEECVRVVNPSGDLYQAFTLGAAVVQADVLISVPKFKTHGFMMFTGAVKNLFGCIPGLEKAQFHLKVPDRDDFGSMLIDLMLACKPALSIMDAVVGMEGEGPAGGTPRHVGAILCSADAVELDVVAAAIAGLDPKEVYTNQAAVRRGFGPESADDVEVLGSAWRDLAVPDFRLPMRDVSSKLPPALARRMRGWTTARPYLERASGCTRCLTCEKVCPVAAVSVGSGGPEFDRQTCIRCYCCQELCPPQVIGLKAPPLARLMSRKR